MPAHIIRSIINKYTGPSANLEDLRLACICSIGLARFFRYDELSNLALAHLKFCPEHLKVSGASFVCLSRCFLSQQSLQKLKLLCHIIVVSRQSKEVSFFLSV